MFFRHSYRQSQTEKYIYIGNEIEREIERNMQSTPVRRSNLMVMAFAAACTAHVLSSCNVDGLNTPLPSYAPML